MKKRNDPYIADAARKETDIVLNELLVRIRSVFESAEEGIAEEVKAYFSKFEKRDKEQLARLESGEITNEEYMQWRLAQIGRGKSLDVLRENCAQRVLRAEEVAAAYINNDLAKVYALNRQYTIDYVAEQCKDVLGGVSFEQWDENTVRRLLTEEPDLMPHYPQERAVNRGISLAESKRKITANITSGIIRGLGTDKIAAELIRDIPNMGWVSAARTARTAVNAAENAGRQDGAEQMEEMGVILEKEWVSANSEKTREWHAAADGQRVMTKEPFIVGGEMLLFPGDASLGATGQNIYNCRCTRVNHVVGFKPIRK